MVVQVRRGGKPVRVLEQVEWSANTYGLELDMIPRAILELLKGRALKWFIANNKQWKTWAEFIDSFHTYFLPRDFFTRLCGSGHATEAGLQRVVQRLHDRHADDGEAT